MASRYAGAPAVDTLKTRPAARTAVRLAYVPDGDHGRRAVTGSARYLKAMREHNVDSLGKPTESAPNFIKIGSEPRFCRPIRGPVQR